MNSSLTQRKCPWSMPKGILWTGSRVKAGSIFDTLTFNWLKVLLGKIPKMKIGFYSLGLKYQLKYQTRVKASFHCATCSPRFSTDIEGRNSLSLIQVSVIAC